MRILHVQRVKGTGGSERHLLFLLPALAEAGVDVRMCVLLTGGGDQFVQDLRAAGVEVTVRRAGPDVNPSLVAGLVSEIRSFRPHLVHTHLVHADVHGQLAASVTRVPGVSSVHDTLDFYRREPFHTAGRVVGRLAARRIAISNYVARYVERLHLAPPERVRTVHYGIDADGFARPGTERESARADLGLTADTVAVGVASRLIPGKGHDVLIDGFAIAAGDNPNLRLLVVGDGEDRAALEARAERSCPAGTVQFFGFVHDIARFMNACDAIAFPTQPEYGEGFGLAALEAMAAGRPLISTDSGPLPEINLDGVTGFVVPARSHSGFARAITDLASDPPLRARLGDAGARRARESFSLDAMVGKTMAVYSELV
jgi:glycosyltransferase involved in cell wall biosynthesis